MTLTAIRPRHRVTTEPAATDVRFVDIRPRRVIAVDGDGRPGGPEFTAAIGALYPVAYGIHFGLRRRGIDARVGALEGLWWAPTDLAPGVVLPTGDETLAHWTLLIEVPPAATDEDVAAAIDAATRKHPSPALGSLHVVVMDEGPCAEVLHIGPYDAERPTIERLHAEIAAAGRRPRGRHHEIYLGDPRRARPDRLRTLLRQPVA